MFAQCRVVATDLIDAKVRNSEYLLEQSFWQRSDAVHGQTYVFWNFPLLIGQFGGKLDPQPLCFDTSIFLNFGNWRISSKKIRQMSSKRNLQSNTFWLFGKIRTLKVNFVSGASDQQDTADDTSQVACAFRNCSGKWSGIQTRLDNWNITSFFN